jgi:hypothetical protein
VEDIEHGWQWQSVSFMFGKSKVCVPGVARNKEGSYTQSKFGQESQLPITRENRRNAQPCLLLVFLSRTTAADNTSVSSVDKGFFG